MSTTVHPPDKQVTTELHAMEQRRQRALVNVDLDTLDELVVVGQHLEPDRAVLACRVADPDQAVGPVRSKV